MIIRKLGIGKGASADAMIFTLIKVITICLGLVATRLLSQHLSTYDYGVYSQVMLIVTSASSLTILGMVDGVNFFYCSAKNEQERDAYTATLFSLQGIVGVVTGVVIAFLGPAISGGFKNPDVIPLFVIAAMLPLMQNLISMLQILVVATGKARMIAFRNLIVSLAKLMVVLLVVKVMQSVAVILLATVCMDTIQIVVFVRTLHHNNCFVSLKKSQFSLVGSIIKYCIPMAVFTVIHTLNRDFDKYLIAWLTSTETLAIYTNASKVLPFDIILASFCTVLQPEITRLVTERKKEEAVALYRIFLEIAYISTGILCIAALCAAPQLMELLYSEKYISGLPIFCIYILVDLIRFTNITLILSAAGKTKKLMYLSFVALAGNAVLNLVLFFAFGVVGPAVATLLVTLSVGVVMLWMSGKELNAGLARLFDLKRLALFLSESLAAIIVFSLMRRLLENTGMHYFVILILIGGPCAGSLLLLNGKRLLQNLKFVNQISKQ